MANKTEPLNLALDARTAARAQVARIENAIDAATDAEAAASDRIANIELLLQEAGPKVALGEATQDEQESLSRELQSEAAKIVTAQATIIGLKRRQMAAEAEAAKAHEKFAALLVATFTPQLMQLRAHARESFAAGFRELAEFLSISWGLVRLCQGTGVMPPVGPDDYAHRSLDEVLDRESAAVGLTRAGESGFLAAAYLGKPEHELMALIKDSQ